MHNFLNFERIELKDKLSEYVCKEDNQCWLEDRSLFLVLFNIYFIPFEGKKKRKKNVNVWFVTT